MIRFLTSGESHGKGLSIIVEGFPSNMKFSAGFINEELRRRQMGYGRGGRMRIEHDRIDVTSGVRFGLTTGAPIGLFIENKNFESWTGLMSTEEAPASYSPVSIPRPGHADLNGTLKYNYSDIRNSIERSSARETAARVAACAVAKMLLGSFNIYTGSYVESIGGIFPEESYSESLFANDLPDNFNAGELALLADKSPLRLLDAAQEESVIQKIDEAKDRGDSLGGTFYVIATGVPEGLGSFVHYDRKISADIASSILSINAVKAVEIGRGFSLASIPGSLADDEIMLSGESISRKSNNSGGIEGGMTNGMPIILRAAMKPIPTLMSPLSSIDLHDFSSVRSRSERSDFVAVPACAVVAEGMLSWTIAEHFLRKFGGDSIEELGENYMRSSAKCLDRVKKKFNDGGICSK